MPEHSPTSAFIGIGGVGAGVVLLYCAYKNVNPFFLIRQAVTTGSIDTSKLPGFFDPSLFSPSAGQLARDAEKLGAPNPQMGGIGPQIGDGQQIAMAIEKWIATGQGDPDGIEKTLKALSDGGNAQAAVVLGEFQAYRSTHPQGEKTK